VPKNILLLYLEAPMQSWGTRSRWDIRETGAEPTKSGVIGLIGCALGLKRHDPDLELLDRKLIFGVRVERPGTIATDYHTVTGYHRAADGGLKFKGGTNAIKNFEKALAYEEYTVLSFRDYLYDAAFLIALSSDDENLLFQIAGHSENNRWAGTLTKPHWPLYLGRKSCVPSRPILERLTKEYQNIEDALQKEPWLIPLSPKNAKTPPPKLTGWIECSEGEYERQDALRLNQLRFYDYRRCRRIEIDTSKLKIVERRIP